MAGDTVSLAFSTSAEYNSFRAMLLKKYKKWADLVEAIGAVNSHEEEYVSAELQRSVPANCPPQNEKLCGGIGIFKLQDSKRKKNVKKLYTLAEIGLTVQDGQSGQFAWVETTPSTVAASEDPDFDWSTPISLDELP